MDYRLIRPFQARIRQLMEQGKHPLLLAPPGAGKTLAAILAIEHCVQSGLCILLANSVTLCQQHVQVVGEWFANLNPPIEVAGCFGGLNPQKRQVIWGRARIVIATGETLQEDLAAGRVDFAKIKLVIFDECHDAHLDSKYCYVPIAQELLSHDHIQRLGLTGTIKNVKSIMRALQLLTVEKVDPDPAQQEGRRIIPYDVKLDPTITTLVEQLRVGKQRLWGDVPEWVRIAINLPARAPARRAILHALDRAAIIKPEEEGKKKDLFTARRHLVAAHFVADMEHLVLSESLYETNRRFRDRAKTEEQIKAQRGDPTIADDKKIKGFSIMPLLGDYRELRGLADEIETLCADGYIHPKDQAVLAYLQLYRREERRALVYCGHKSMIDQITKLCDGRGLPTGSITGDHTKNHNNGVVEQYTAKKLDFILATTAFLYGIDLAGIDAVVLRSRPVNADQFNQLHGRHTRVPGSQGVTVPLIADDPVERLYYLITMMPAFGRKKRAKKSVSPRQQILAFA
ncbi:MAG: DEAD/DEAH box helicase [Patescibacteria group bacterium]